MPLGGGGGGGGWVYVHRGDPSSADWTQADLTGDDAWHELDISSVVTDEDATMVMFAMSISDNSTNKTLGVRPSENSEDYNVNNFRTYASNIRSYGIGQVVLTEGRKVDYWLSSAVTSATITVAGWWKPA